MLMRGLQTASSFCFSHRVQFLWDLKFKGKEFTLVPELKASFTRTTDWGKTQTKEHV